MESLRLFEVGKSEMSYEIDLIVELAILNGYNFVAVYSFDNVVKRRKMSFKDSLIKLQLKLDKEPKTIEVDFKIEL